MARWLIDKDFSFYRWEDITGKELTVLCDKVTSILSLLIGPPSELTLVEVGV